MRFTPLLLTFSLVGLLGCVDPYPPTPKPDYTIRVMHTGTGMVAIPPNCPSWTTEVTDPFDNQLTPQMGCANARNLAMMVENPQDLVRAQELGTTRGVEQVGAMRRFDNDQTRGLIWTGSDPNTVSTTTASTAASAMSGDITGSSSGASSSSSSGP